MLPTLRTTAWVLAALILVAAEPVRASGADDFVVLTVSGEVSNPNRGPVDSFDDGILMALEERFEKARTFAYGDLLALPQDDLVLKYPNWPREIRFRGPRLADILDVAGATGDMVMVQALDGYAPSFERSKLEKAQVILALNADGRPIPLGGRGPLWLVFPKGALADGDAVEDDTGLVWAVFHIKVTNED